tara:strand:- start:764 stop:1123 length:360 start_codon:yes stop_codon:yes gene_type:complete
MSATTVTNNTRTFVAGEALDAYLLVEVQSDGTVDKSAGTAGELVIGFTVAPAASGEAASISLVHGGGTSYGVASEAFAIGDKVYSGASGKLVTATTGALVGITLTTATADGDVIEVAAI